MHCHPFQQATSIAARVGKALGREDSKAIPNTHIYCLGIGNGVHRAFLDGAPLPKPSNLLFHQYLPCFPGFC